MEMRIPSGSGTPPLQNTRRSADIKLIYQSMDKDRFGKLNASLAKFIEMNKSSIFA